MYKNIFTTLLLVFFIAACSSTTDGTNKTEEKREITTESNKPVGSKDKEQPVKKEIVEPSEKMKDWASFTQQKKIEVVKKGIEYEKEQQAIKRSPVKVVGTTEEFVKIIDERYVEIEGFEGYEKYRMMDSTIAAQVGIMGHAKQLLEFDYGGQ
ncbi:hypothetical protein CN964_30275 [Bacillus cereus]|uniref:hypothetical protein n=1 Tax=Bacillus cereus group TaxID=86661 RepID=UPI000BF3E67E|nr:MULTISPECIES: hypothetical protein [Bacillus cereus group]MBE5093605.1 hypothetical protein [Bacillus thuringiensis]PFJ23961.1 hypothetical protein COI90_30585 [Bacillus cereus]PFO24951.1 hypothetical protein COJ80_13100 [Bacillus cereus]PGN65896.1 hypothetical protein CN964_30275 [Bacillus cereus]